MDLGKPIVEHGTADIAQLREKMLQQPTAFWEIDRKSRTKLAGDRPGNAVFFYNDLPPCVERLPLIEARSGFVNVLHYVSRPLFAEIQTLIKTKIIPLFPNCDVLRVQLAELPPGQAIKPHYDRGILALIHRLHVPIVSHPQVKFVIAGQSFFLEEGMLYDLNNVVVHSVENNSDVMRIHLMVDMLPHSVARARYHNTEESMMSACTG
jgi:hypothetical protein